MKGFGAAILVLCTVGCGGNVVVDGSSSSSSSGAGGATSGSSSSSSSASSSSSNVSSSSSGAGGGCPAGTCTVDGQGGCQEPTGPQGNACCQCMNGVCTELCECASPDTAIATPSGERAIATLRVGDLVYTVDHGAVVVAPIAATHQTAVGPEHRVVRVRLTNGAVLEISRGHPTLDGRTFADLRTGGSLGGVGIASVEWVPYGLDRTYDILAASDSGGYFANGVLIGSTLAPAARVEP